MLIPIFFIILCSNFLFIKSEDNGNVTIEIKPGENCTIKQYNYTFTEGQNVTLVVQHEKHINHGWWRHITSSGSKDLFAGIKSESIEQKSTITRKTLVTKSMEGTWEFQFLYFPENLNFQQDHHKIIYNNQNFTESTCRTNVTIVPAITAADQNQNNDQFYKYVVTASILGAIAVIITLAQTAYIIYLKAKVQKLNMHNHLTKKTEPAPNDTVRYCSNPGQKIVRGAAPVDDDNRDSVIYEAPNIELSESARWPMQPPQPPAINTIPRQREINVVSRPPLPLPPKGQAHMSEVYEDINNKQDTYEPPPVFTANPPRLPMPPKKVPTSNLLNVKEDTLGRRIKPSLTPKPQKSDHIHKTPANEFDQARRRRNDTIPKAKESDQVLKRRNHDPIPVANELEQALKRRNHVKQVPIKSVPEPSSRISPNPRPPPAVISKLRAPPVHHPVQEGPPPTVKSKLSAPPAHHPVQEETYYNDAHASSDEEWTYEPLQPCKSYDTNIYSV